MFCARRQVLLKVRSSWLDSSDDTLLFYFHSAAADSFKYKEFFAKVGLSAKSAEEVKKAFFVIDQDKSGFIEEAELK